MITAILAFIIDTVVGDPRSKLHPVVLIGQLIAAFEKFAYRESDSDGRKLFMGGLVVASVLFFTYEVTCAIINVVGIYHNIYLNYLVEAFILSFTISPNSLAAAGKELYGYLIKGDLKNARYKVGWIVGRDTDKLSEGEVTRATVETIAENTTDGIIAPFFFFILGGVPLAMLYRAANTMDSMMGYKNDKYLYFGRCAARLDDVLNYIPARITGVLFIISAAILHFDAKNAWKILRRDASKHPSPNGGWAEAPAAGALHIRLGGYNSYFGRMTFREYMGDPIEELEAKHIMMCIRLMYTATVLFLIIAHVLFQLHDVGVF